MLHNENDLFGRMQKRHKTQRKWTVLFLALAVLVGVGTVSMLIRPGIAVEGKRICGLEEHTHSDSCYQRHLVCENTEPDHVHTDECYAFDYQLTCGQEEGPEHTHTDACWEKIRICGKQAHVHDQNCYETVEPTEAVLPSTQPTDSAATVETTEPTQTETTAPTAAPETSAPTEETVPETEATEAETTEEATEPEATASETEAAEETVPQGELICDKPEHIHTDACYEKKLICGQEEGPEHTHTDACYEKHLVCGLEEHSHTAECYAPQEQAVSVEDLPQNRIPEEYTDKRTVQGPSGCTVTVYAKPGILPEDVQPSASMLDQAQEEYQRALEHLMAAGISYDYVRVLDLSLLDGEGNSIEPEQPVYVQIRVGELMPQEANLATLAIQHHSAVSEEAGEPDDRSLFSSAVTVETVVGNNCGGLELDETSRAVATFPTEGFSVYTLTASKLPSEIPTVSTRQYGIQIDLFDYNENPINIGRKLHFGQEGQKDTYNAWTGNNGGVYTGIVKDYLSKDGYPVMSDSGQSLDYLFGQGYWGIEQSLTNLDHLFQRDEDGYFHYNSSQNFAEAPTGSGGDFKVYNSPAPGDTHNPKFMPFNTYEQISSPVMHPVFPNQDGNRNYLFGMHLRIPFLMPPDGKLEGKDMIFEFAGDDDVWVFVDGKLALDLGGIHDSYQGCINFQNGAVTTDSKGKYDQYGGNCPNLYGAQGRPGAYTKHTIDFFYLERGKGGSNCQLKFNLIAMNHSLVVGKRLPETIRALAPTEQIQFRYKVETQNPGDAQRKPLADAKGTVYRWDHNNPGSAVCTRKLTTEKDGTFYLRPDERIHFADQIQLDQAGADEKHAVKIFVSEILPNGISMERVSASVGAEDLPDTCVQYQGQNVIPPLYEMGGKNYHKNDSQLTIQSNESGESIYTAVLSSDRNNKFNWVDFENDPGKLCKLEVTKRAFYEDRQTPVTNEKFPVKIELYDEHEQKWIAIPKGTRYAVTQSGTQPGDPQSWNLRSPDNGLIYIGHDETIHMYLFPGTQYRITEPLEAAGYQQTYTGTDGVTSLQQSQWEENGVARSGIKGGPVSAGSTQSIEIQNVVKPNILKIQKKVVGRTTQERFCIHVELWEQDKFQPLQEGTGYWLLHDGQRQEMKVGADGEISFQADDSIFLVLPNGAHYRVYEVLTPEQKDFYTPTYDGTVTTSGTSQPLPQQQWQDGNVGIGCEAVARESEHSIVITNTFVQGGSLTIKKQVLFNGAEDPGNQNVFPFRVTLNNERQIMQGQTVTLETETSSDGTNWSPGPKMVFTRQNSGKYQTDKVMLQNGQSLRVLNIPALQSATVEELPTPGYAVSWQGSAIPDSAAKQTSSITTNVIGAGEALAVVCINATGTELPETGGMGVLPFTLVGSLLLLAALTLVFKRRNCGV